MSTNSAPAARPVWLLDVDGVLCLNRRQLQPATWEHWQEHSTFRFSPTLTGQLAVMHESGAVELCWLTTWEEEANAILSPLFGFPQLRTLRQVSRDEHASKSALSRRWWKLVEAQTVLAEDPGRPVIWTDDDLAANRAARVWAARTPQVLGISPTEEEGLTPSQVDQAVKFLAAHATARLA